MIDVENKVFDTVYTNLIAYNSNMASSVYGEYVAKSATFPAVTITEIDNEDDSFTNTADCPENTATITYEVNAYSDLQNGARDECKAIMSVVDDSMHSLGFRRIARRRLPNVDRTLYRMYARYRATIAKPVEIDGDTVYMVYRR